MHEFGSKFTQILNFKKIQSYITILMSLHILLNLFYFIYSENYNFI